MVILTPLTSAENKIQAYFFPPSPTVLSIQLISHTSPSFYVRKTYSYIKSQKHENLELKWFRRRKRVFWNVNYIHLIRNALSALIFFSIRISPILKFQLHMADIKRFTNPVLSITPCIDIYFNTHDFPELTLLQSSDDSLSLYERYFILYFKISGDAWDKIREFLNSPVS
jgi:hypothetical protein